MEPRALPGFRIGKPSAEDIAASGVFFLIIQFAITQPVADARLGNYEFRPGWVSFDFLPELGHVHANMVRHVRVSMSPHFSQYLAMCQDPTCVASE